MVGGRGIKGGAWGGNGGIGVDIGGMAHRMTDLEMLGEILRMIRIRANYTLRDFCLKWKLDIGKHSLIERGLLRPTKADVNWYVRRVKDQRRYGYKKPAQL